MVMLSIMLGLGLMLSVMMDLGIDKNLGLKY